MTEAPISRTVLAALALAVGSSACAEVYLPRPGGAIVVAGNGSNGYRIFKNGEDMGSEWSIRDAVSGDPRAEAEADKAASERIGAIAANIGGAIAWGVGWTMFADD